ncbi:MAG: hypothetical protein LOD85_11040, partial [Clostridia bacterium]
LLDFGFSQLKAEIVAKKGDVLAEVDVIKGREKRLALVAGADLAVSMPRDSESRPETEIVLERRPVAPIEEGEVLAQLVARLDGEEVGRVPLMAERGVARAPLFLLVGRYFLEITRLF